MGARSPLGRRLHAQSLLGPTSPSFSSPPSLPPSNPSPAAVLGSNQPGADELAVARVMASIADRVMVQLASPYTFPSYHEKIEAPYDYYAFGQRYVKFLVDFSKSAVGHLERFNAVQAALDSGENVVLLANHQTEADPAVWSLLLEATHPRLAKAIIHVAGDRVVTDALCAPFSMGRNLFCVHSKKHMDDVPELRDAKQAINRKTVTLMIKALNEGGKLLWIAPSGGRDRPSAETGAWSPAPFDPAAVELMRQLTAKAKPAGHLYPLAMESGSMMPPPPATEKAVGERRLTNYVGVGIALGAKLDVEAIVAGIDEADRDARSAAVGAAAQKAVEGEYAGLLAAMAAGPGSWGGAYSQPWRKA